MFISLGKRRSTIDQDSPPSKSQEPTTVFTPWQQETHQQYASSQFRNFLDSKLKHPDFANRDWALQGSCSSIPDIESYTQNLMSPSEQKMDSGRIEAPSVRRHTAEKLRIKNRSSFLSPKKQTSTLETYPNEMSSMPNTPKSYSKKSLAVLVNSKSNDFWNRYNKKLDSKFAVLVTKQKSEMNLVSSRNNINKDKTLAKFLKKRISTQSNEVDILIGKPKNSTVLQYRNSSPEKSQVMRTTEDYQNIQNDNSSQSSDEELSSSPSRFSDYQEFEGSKLQEDYKQRKNRALAAPKKVVEPYKNYEGLQRKSEQVMTVSRVLLSGQKGAQNRVATSPDHLNERFTSIERLKSLASEGNSLLAVRGTTPVNFNSHLVRASAPNVLRPSTRGGESLKRHLSSEIEGKNDSVILNSISMTNKIWSQHINQYEVAQIPLLQNLKTGLQGLRSSEKPMRSKVLQLTPSSSKTAHLKPHLLRISQIVSLPNSGVSSPNVSQFFHLNKDFKTLATEEDQKSIKIPSKPRTKVTVESFRTSSQRKTTSKDPKTLTVKRK